MRIVSQRRWKERHKRRKARLKERLVPCECCGYPISQRHHILPVAEYGESDWTVQLCANCHELLHIIEVAWPDMAMYGVKAKTRAARTLRAIWFAPGYNDAQFQFLHTIVKEKEVFIERLAELFFNE